MQLMNSTKKKKAKNSNKLNFSFHPKQTKKILSTL